MPKQGQYKKRETVKPNPQEQFNYKFELSTPHNEEFSRYLFYEVYNTMAWNPHSVHMTASHTIHCPNHWRISIQPMTNRVLVEANAKTFSTRKGLKFNCVKETVTIG
jgi:hypothetical protein